MTEKGYFKKIREELGQSKTNKTELNNFQKHFYREYKEAGYDFKILQEFNEKCLALAVKPDTEEMKQFFEEIFEKTWYNLLNSLDMALLFNDSTKFTPKQKALLSLYFYLNLVEGACAENIQVIVFLLIKNGHYIYDPRKMKYVETYRDLEKIDLYVKEQFLSAYGFGFCASVIDRELRNCIAHQDYVIFDDGKIKNLKTGQMIDIEKKVHNVMMMNSLISMTLYQIVDVICPESDIFLNE
jgi:uncharacterized protein (UPF0335 family)